MPVLKPFDELRWRANKFWGRLPSRKPPDRLYHYTTANGLFGILQSGVIRGSNQLFLNDRAEYAYGAALARRVLAERATKTDTLRRLSASVAACDEKPAGFFHFDVYVASFCETADLLSQWCGYGAGDGRYCIEFDVSGLGKAGFSATFPTHWPEFMIYDEPAQIELFAAVTDRFIAALPKILQRYGESPKTYDEAAKVFFRCCQHGMLRFKHPSFLEEREWRAIQLGFANVHTRLLHFVHRDGVMVPTVDLLKGSNTRLPITKIIVGPSRQSERLVRSAQLMITHFGYENVQIDVSQVPLSS